MGFWNHIQKVQSGSQDTRLGHLSLAIVFLRLKSPVPLGCPCRHKLVFALKSQLCNIYDFEKGLEAERAERWQGRGTVICYELNVGISPGFYMPEFLSGTSKESGWVRSKASDPDLTRLVSSEQETLEPKFSLSLSLAVSILQGKAMSTHSERRGISRSVCVASWPWTSSLQSCEIITSAL